MTPVSLSIVSRLVFPESCEWKQCILPRLTFRALIPNRVVKLWETHAFGCAGRDTDAPAVGVVSSIAMALISHDRFSVLAGN
ncbi:hypothetical protein AURDEDRAFT_176294 [Auricularia subglabra TFB-10046 SS5]|uniref:Uncharacterized protein n=1 Tax=Auricularia subglabra (strain TFB-10046 / SS5) TaxID=717982 RepID=J0WRN2_AURST|nr:hypothetical protein AURDEDRAFT_176294 [Auricularia subglabra TFB-10046 SS5]